MALSRSNEVGLAQFNTGSLVSKSNVKAVKIDAGFDLLTEDDESLEAVERILQFTQPLMYIVKTDDSSSEIVLNQDETNYDNVGDNGTFAAGAAHVVGDVITVTGAANVTVDAVDGALISSQDETDYTGAGSNGSFDGGSNFADGDTITLSNGDIITVDANVAGAVSEFTVTTVNGDAVAGTAIEQSSTDGSGTGFELTPGDNNVAGSVTEFTISATGSGNASAGDTLSQTATTGSGTGFTITLGENNESGGGGIIHAIVDGSQFSAASLQDSLRAIGVDNVNGKDFSGVTVTEGTDITVA